MPAVLRLEHRRGSHRARIAEGLRCAGMGAARPLRDGRPKSGRLAGRRRLQRRSTANPCVAPPGVLPMALSLLLEPRSALVTDLVVACGKQMADVVVLVHPQRLAIGLE